MRVLMVNGPNLNLLGRREPEIYGTSTLSDLERRVGDWAEKMGIEFDARHSNDEGEIVDLLQETDADGVILNPGALTHTSRTIADAVRAIETPVVEVHISNIRERESWRSHSVLSHVAANSIYGRGISGYRDALRHLVNRAAMPFEAVAYGPHPQQVGDLRRGGGDLVVLVHGGIWRHEYGRDTTESLAVDLCNRGYDTWNVTYRRFGLDGGWPASGHDLLMALDFVPQMNLDFGRVLVVGHSAGAYLAMWAANRTKTQITLDVALAPITDLGAAVEENTPCAPECSQMIDQGAPTPISPGNVPTLLVHGETDAISPVTQSRGLARRHGIEIMTFDGDHFEVLDPTKSPWAAVLDRLAG